MSPKKLTTKPADKAWATGRRRVAEKYYGVVNMLEHDNGLAINVCVKLCVLAGIAAGDAICAAATGERYSGPDHMAAAELRERVERECGKRLRALAALKPPAHYGTGLLTDKYRVGALRDARYPISEAARRTGGSAPA